MEDLHYAGGLPAVMKELGGHIDLDAPTVGGQRLADIVASAECFNREVIRSIDAPIRADSGIWVLSGNLCPGGAIMKPSAASPDLLRHRGRAIVFESIEDLHARIDDAGLEVDASSILVLRGCGPRAIRACQKSATCPCRENFWSRA